MLSKGKEQGLRQRLESLETRHADLETRIEAEMTRPMPDLLRIQKLKRLKLRVKDEIESISGVLRTLERPSMPGVA